MGIWKKQQSANLSARPRPARPASHQRADDVRRKAQHYTEITEQTGNQNIDQHRTSRQRERAEREMAALRAEAVQARRLATQIENLHQPARAHRKGRIMNATIADPGQAQRMKRRATDNPPSAAGQLNFNPLHPSMELPPEQLIRLLGLEHKAKRRRKHPKPVPTATGENTSADTTPANKPVKLSLPQTLPARAERERDTAVPPLEESHRRFLVPSIIVGTAAGIIVSAYLFLSSPEDIVSPVTQTAPDSTADRQAFSLPDNAGVVPTAAPAPAATSANLARGTVKRTQVIPQADIEPEKKRLRNNAEQRFTERMMMETGNPAPVETDIARDNIADAAITATESAGQGGGTIETVTEELF